MFHIDNGYCPMVNVNLHAARQLLLTWYSNAVGKLTWYSDVAGKLTWYSNAVGKLTWYSDAVGKL